MKLLSVNLARAIWVFNLQELNPYGKYAGHLLVNGLVNKYGFSKYPKTPEEMDETKGIQFQTGQFMPPSGEAIILLSLTIYAWGVVVDTRSSTQDSEACLKDGLDWAVREFGFAPYADVIKSKAYLSEVHVRTDKSLDSLNQRLKSFAEKLTSLVKGHGPMSYRTGGISFWNDPATNNMNFPFRFERVESTQFGENRYYSVAPLETNIHLEMLNEFENILS